MRRTELAPDDPGLDHGETPDLIAIPKRVPHAFEQKGADPFVILVNATPGWDPLKDTRYLE